MNYTSSLIKLNDELTSIDVNKPVILRKHAKKRVLKEYRKLFNRSFDELTSITPAMIIDFCNLVSSARLMGLDIDSDKVKVDFDRSGISGKITLVNMENDESYYAVKAIIDEDDNSYIDFILFIGKNKSYINKQYKTIDYQYKEPIWNVVKLKDILLDAGAFPITIIILRLIAEAVFDAIRIKFKIAKE